MKKVLSLIIAIIMFGSIIFNVGAAEKTEFVKFSNFTNLDFEDESQYGYYVSPEIYGDSGNEPYKLILNGENEWAAQNGNGAVYIGGTAYVAMWGGTTSSNGGNIAQDGDLISGTYWLKIMEEKPYSHWMQPKIRIYMTDAENNQTDLAITKDLNTSSVENCKPFEWTQLELESTGVAYDADCKSLGFEITTGYLSELQYMIDNIEVGTYKEVKDTGVVAYTPYNLTNKFNFEDLTAFTSGTNYWCSSNVLDFKYDDADFPAANGLGAVYVDGKNGGFSFWGGSQVWEAPENSVLTGSFKFKLMQPLYNAEEAEASGSSWFKLPKITFTNSKDEVVASFNPAEVSVVDIGAYTWAELPIKSTGITVNTNEVIDYVITNTPDSGIVYMLDDIFIGGVKEEEEDDEPLTPGEVVFGAVAKTENYSIFNGDFEKFGGALYQQTAWPDNWGMWTVNQANDDGADAFNFVKNTDKAYSGNAMLEAVRGGTMWNIQTDVSMAEGKLIAGSYMLYADEEADVNYYPNVYVKYLLNGEEVTVAQSPTNTEEFPLKAGWNKIPVMPNGIKIPENTEKITLMIVAPTTEGNDNGEYAEKFCIDNIVIGAVVSDLYINEASAVQINDDSVSCSVVVTNTEEETDISADLITAVYQDNKLAGVSYLKNVKINGCGESGVISTEFVADIDTKLSGDDIKVSVMLWDDMMKPVLAKSDIYKTVNLFAYDDENIVYTGRWEESKNCMNSGWGGAYFETEFTGSSAALVLDGAADIYVSIDKEADKAYNIAGKETLVVASGLDDGTHTLRVAAKYIFDSIRLEGIILDDGAVLEKPDASDLVIEFIGDSNTAGYLLPNNQLDNYSWLVGEELDAEHIHIAYTGMALSDGIYNNNIHRDVGMSVMYNKAKPMHDRTSPDWDTSAYSPDVICINIGGNDVNKTAVPGGVDEFTKTLPVFLEGLRSTHPDAHIIVLIPTSSPQGTELHTIIPDVVNGLSDEKITYYDANAWICDDMENNILSDGVHISQQGNKIVAQKLVEIIKGILNL